MTRRIATSGLVMVGLCMVASTELMAQTASGGAAQATAQQQMEAPQTGAGGQQMRTGGMTGVGRETARRETAERSSSLTVTVEGRSEALTVQQLEAMPQRTVTVHNGHSNADETYTGVAVSDLLGRMGVQMAQGGAMGMAAVPANGPDTGHDGARARLLRSFLRATGTDFYHVVYSGVELQPAMHAGEVIVATKRNGQGLGDAGQLMLVSTEDKVPARWVRNLQSITLTAID